MPYLGDSIPDNPRELAYNEILHSHHFSFQGKNAPATVSGKTPTERLHNAWLKLQTDVNCCIDSDLDKLSTVKFPGIRQVCVCVCFQVDCGTGTFVTSFNLANLHLEEMWTTHIYTQKSSACQYLSCPILKFQDSACQLLKFQYFACKILKFQYFACQIFKFQHAEY